MLKIFPGPPVFLGQDFVLLHLGQVLDRDVAIYAAHDAAAILLHLGGEGFNLVGGLTKQFVKALSEKHVVDGARGEHLGMIKRRSKVALQLAHALQDAGIHELVKGTELVRLLVQILELAQQLLVLGRQRLHRFGDDLLDLKFVFLRLLLAEDIRIGFADVSSAGGRGRALGGGARIAQKIRPQEVGLVAVGIKVRRLEDVIAEQ